MKDSLPYPAGTRVVVMKLSACENPLSEPSFWADWKPGETNEKSLPIAYELRGVLLAPVEIGEDIHVFRTHRNGIRADGFFQSTFVCDIPDDSTVVTCNSVYRIVPDMEFSETALTNREILPDLDERE